MRGIFAIVTQGDETRMVLQGFDPENRKIVYVVLLGVNGETLVGEKVQDSYGMSRPQDVKLESWYRRMQDDPV